MIYTFKHKDSDLKITISSESEIEAQIELTLVVKNRYDFELVDNDKICKCDDNSQNY